MNPQPFLEFARERHRIYSRRQHGQTAPWTEDPILQKFRFTNVFRELDATTIWFRENVRDPMRDQPEVLLATVLFRWFNRITTGEAIFCQSNLLGYPVWKLRDQDTEEWLSIVADSIKSFCGDGPYVTGAYIIKTPDGLKKLDGVLWCVEQFMTHKNELSLAVKIDVGWEEMAKLASHLGECENIEDPQPVSLEQMWEWLRQFPYLGDFMAYEIVTDLRHTALLENAPDICTWANPGPGAMRGMNRLLERDKNYRQPKHAFVCEMRELLDICATSPLWPINPLGLPVEMRDIEHTLCEFDKYERVRTGEGRPRGVYRHG